MTSRRHLGDLGTVRPVRLDTLPPDEAPRCSSGSLPAPGQPGDRRWPQMTGLGGYLPLAISLLARQLHHHPAWTLAGWSPSWPPRGTGWS